MFGSLMKRYVVHAVLCTVLGLSAACGAGIEVTRTDDTLVVNNGLWRLHLARDRGWGITRMRDEAGGAELHGEFFRTLVRPKARRVNDGGMAPEEELSARAGRNLGLEVTEQSPDRVVLVRRWQLAVGRVIETTRFAAGARRFEREVVLEATNAVAELWAEARCDNPNLAAEAIFLPEERRIAGTSPITTAGLPYIETYYPGPQIGFGIKPGPGLARQGRWAFGDPERGDDDHPVVRTRNYAGVRVYAPVLAYEDVPGTFTIAYTGYMSVDRQRPITVELPDVELREAWPRKMIARPGEGNTVDIAVRNNTDQPRQVRIEIVLRHGIDESITLADMPLELPPAATVERELAIDTAAIRYGAEVSATLTGPAADDVQRKAAFFTVWPRYYRVSPLMEIMTPGGARGALARAVPRMRRGYVGVTEVYTWPPDPLFDMTPETDWFVPQGNSLAAYMVAWSSKYMRDMISAAHENGMAFVSWAQGHTTVKTALEHPEVVMYGANGEWTTDYYRIYPDAGKRTRGIFQGDVETTDPGFRYSDPATARMWGEEMGRSARMFGWDGVRFDGPAPRFAGAAPVDPLKWREAGKGFYDFEGNVIGVREGEDPDEVSLHNMQAWLDAARQGNPDFELGMNIGHGLIEEDQPDMENRMLVSRWPKSLAFVGRNHGMLLHEGALSVTRAGWNRWDTWTEKLIGTSRITQRLGAVCTVGALRWLPPIPDRTRSYVAFASAYRLAYIGSMAHSYGSGERFKAAEFAVRFGEFLFGADHELLPGDQQQVTVEGHARLHWKPFVRRRALADGGIERVVHIVNLPADDIIAKNAERPPARTGTKVRVEREGAVTGAWMLLPDPPRALAREWRTKDNRIEIDLEPIDAFATVVVREAGDEHGGI